MGAPEPLLRVEDVHTYYGDSYVLQGLSLLVPPARIVGLLGRNGMGKTTLIRSIMGLTPPRRGSIAFRGAELAGQPPHAIARLGIGLVPQGRRIFPSLTVRENLLLPTSGLTGRRAGAGSLSGGRDRVRGGASGSDGRVDTRRWTLETVLREFPQLAERTGARAHHLSGGEQQMLAIGRALMTNPDLILMDEPSEGLAPVLVRQLAGILGGLRRHGHSVLLVEQNVELALAVADHIYLLTTGRIVHGAPAADLRAAPETLAHHLALPTG